MVLYMYYQCNSFSVLTMLCGFPNQILKEVSKILLPSAN